MALEATAAAVIVAAVAVAATGAAAGSDVSEYYIFEMQ